MTPPLNSHVHAGYRNFGLRPRIRALCSCGYQTPPRDDADTAFTQLLVEHGAWVPETGESVTIPYLQEPR